MEPFAPAFFVNLPVRYIESHPDYLAFFVEHRLHPEIGLDPLVLDRLPAGRHEAIADRLGKAGLFASVHLPFFDLQPGSLDDLVLEATRARLRKAFEVASLYSPRHLVGHASFSVLYAAEFREEWLSRSVDSWRILDQVWPDHPPLFLENTHEGSPKPLADLLAALRGKGMERAGICFDIGHWNSFAGGPARQDLSVWVDAYAPFIGHLHLHDNDGTADQHLGLGLGNAPIQDLMSRLKALGLSPTITLEPHTAEDLRHSLDFIGGHAGIIV